jgi:AcrR family transcriptional regulator
MARAQGATAGVLAIVESDRDMAAATDYRVRLPIDEKEVRLAAPKAQLLKTGAPGGLREQIKAERAQAILNVARDLFQEKGFDQATTLEIAERAGVGAGTVFKYFPTKDALLFAVVNTALIPVHRRAARLAATETGLLPRLVTFYWQILDFHLANIDLSRSFLRLLTPSTILLIRPVDENQPRGPVPTTMGFVAEAASAGELEADIPVADFAENCFAIFLDVLNRALMLDPTMADPHERLVQRLSLQIRPLCRSAP